MHRLALVTVLAATACYGAAYPAPATPELPPRAPGATLDVEVDSTRYWSESRGRYVTGHLISGMSYNNIPLTYHQVRTLADPTWGGKLAAYRDLVKRCRRANIPRYLGFAGIATGGALYAGGGAVFQENGRLQATVSLTLLGFGVASYAAGYLFLGGGACREAEHEAERLHLGATDEVKIYNDDLIDEIAHIAESFNKRAAHAAAEEPADAR